MEDVAEDNPAVPHWLQQALQVLGASFLCCVLSDVSIVGERYILLD